MSGHNPHGHLSQPNSSWNPLQIPSYIPRQPQLAHMSNERPLTWRTPTPPEAIYSFISANHKNLELNPLLPSFVRGPAPFGSMDLTIQSARNSTTPSPRNLTSPPPEFVHNKSIPCSVSQSSLSSSISPNPGVIQTTGSVREKYVSSNGNNGEIPSPGSLFVRDVRQINNELVKMASREPVENADEPVELVKESNYQTTKGHPVSTSPKRSSPLRSCSISSSAPLPSQQESHALPVPTANALTELVNNHITSVMPQKSAIETINTDQSPVCSAVPSPANTTSNEDSIDSSGSKTRRKRKPNKTVRVSNDSDDSLPSNKDKDLSSKISDPIIKTPIFENEARPLEVTQVNVNEAVSNGNEKQLVSTETDVKVNNCSESTITITEPKNERIEIKNGTSEVEPALETQSENSQIDTVPSVIVENTVNRSDIPSDKIESFQISNENICLDPTSEQSAPTNCLESPMKRSKRKGDSDDIETIDKIAAMIANPNENEDAITECTLKEVEKIETQDDKNEAQNRSSSNSKINDLTEILAAPISENKPSQPPLETPKENCFEEVENKLEEMFAGIEDERPLCVEAAPVDTCEERGSHEVTCDLGLELPLQHGKSEVPADHTKQISLPQKRSHSTKHDQVPPKKKRKITKKPLSNQKTVKSKSKHVLKPTVTEKNLKEKVKDEPILDVKYKGPYVQVKPDGSINVINAPTAEDDAEKLSKVKKSIHNHTNSERSKIRGLHISTLSTKYDADTTDASWMCVFCKRGPHKMGLGDLFGPYIVTTSCEEFELSQKDPSDDEFISKRIKADMFQKQCNMLPVVPASTTAASINAGSFNSKKKRKATDSPTVTKTQQFSVNPDEILFGMSKVSDTSYEVWVHEDCAVWAPGVYLLGARIVGLEAAVWSSTRYKCSICSHNGAVICCLHRGCVEKAHIPCASDQNWVLNEVEYKSLCENHSGPGS